MAETMSLCVSCKGCRRECPTGVDMAKMKLEFLAQYRKGHRLTLRDRLIAYFAARCAARPPASPAAQRADAERVSGAPRREALWASRAKRRLAALVVPPLSACASSAGNGREVVLLARWTFNRYRSAG